MVDLPLELEKIGLSKQEALVYTSCLKLGLAKNSEIAQKSGINREGCYYVLRLLNEKGLISEVIKSGVKHYSAVQPKRILEIIEEEKNEKTRKLKEIIPALESLQNVSLSHPKIEFYEGEEGLKTAASIITRKPNQTICCYVPESILHFTPYFHPLFRMRRKEKKIKLKVITQKTPFLINDLKKTDKKELRETRFNDKVIRGMDVAFYILEDGIIILKANEKEQMGFYIQDKSLAKLQQHIFDMIWKESKN